MLTQLGRGISTSNSNNAVISPIIDTSSKTVALFGDSFMSQHTEDTTTKNFFENVGWFNVANYKMNNRFKLEIDLNFGLSGDSTVELAARKEDMAGSNADIYSLLWAAQMILAPKQHLLQFNLPCQKYITIFLIHSMVRCTL